MIGMRYLAALPLCLTAAVPLPAHAQVMKVAETCVLYHKPYPSSLGPSVKCTPASVPTPARVASIEDRAAALEKENLQLKAEFCAMRTLLVGVVARLEESGAVDQKTAAGGSSQVAGLGPSEPSTNVCPSKPAN